MLVGNSIPEYVFTRLAIWGLRAIAPASLAYSAIAILQPGHSLLKTRWLVPLHAWMFAEVIFYAAVYLPLRSYLQRPAQHPPPLSRPERKQLFHTVKAGVSDPDSYLSKWFMNARVEDIKRENLKEFFAWSLLNQRLELLDDDELAELDGYVDELEMTFGRRFEDGWGSATPLRGTLDFVPMQHRPLLWYGIVLIVDVYSCLRMWYRYTLYRSPGLRPLKMLPQRWHTFLAGHTSESPHLSYWYREHTSKSRLPVLFIHGIGVGIFTYVGFLNALAAGSQVGADADADDGQVGIIALELTSISARICDSMPDTTHLRHEVHRILNRHGWTDFILAAHSYGTAVASNMIQHQLFQDRIKAAVLMDPICFALHLPDVAYNFTRRRPTKANEYMLYYFASQDMMVSETLARHFFWSEYILWKDDVPDFPLTVTLSGNDLIVPKEEVWRYLTGSGIEMFTSQGALGGAPRTREAAAGAIQALWFDDFDHAGLFASKAAYQRIARLVTEHSQQAAETELAA